MLTHNRGLPPELRHRLLVAVGVTAQDLARQLREQPDAPVSLAQVIAQERQRQDASR